MEGYLLVFQPQRHHRFRRHHTPLLHAQVLFCQLEDGQINCFEEPPAMNTNTASCWDPLANQQMCDGERQPLRSIYLTKHAVQVELLDSFESLVPNSFELRTQQVDFNRDDNRFAATSRVQVFTFAASTKKLMEKWIRALRTWHRNSFASPEVHPLALVNSTPTPTPVTPTPTPTPTTTLTMDSDMEMDDLELEKAQQRHEENEKKLLATQRKNLLFIAECYDVIVDPAGHCQAKAYSGGSSSTIPTFTTTTSSTTAAVATSTANNTMKNSNMIKVSTKNANSELLLKKSKGVASLFRVGELRRFLDKMLSKQ